LKKKWQNFIKTKELINNHLFSSIFLGGDSQTSNG